MLQKVLFGGRDCLVVAGLGPILSRSGGIGAGVVVFSWRHLAGGTYGDRVHLVVGVHVFDCQSGLLQAYVLLVAAGRAMRSCLLGKYLRSCFQGASFPFSFSFLILEGKKRERRNERRIKPFFALY